VDPTDWATIYGSVSGNGGQHIWRFDLRTGGQQYIRPTPAHAAGTDGGAGGSGRASAGDGRGGGRANAGGGRNSVALPAAGNIVTPLDPNEVLRYNWIPGLAMSPHDPRTIYFGANRLFISRDRGDSWSATKDLTKAINRDTLPIMSVPGSQPMTAKHDGVAAWGTIVAIAESPVAPGVLWVGTDDGNLQLSKDGGTTWANVAGNAATFPAVYYAAAVEPSHYDAGAAFAAFDGHLAGDYRPHVFKTSDYGSTWTNIGASLPPRGHVNVVREDRFNRNLLFVGTEFGFFISIDGGKAWAPFMNNLPATISDDVIVHPRDQDLVLATHGRSFYVMDDITPLQQLTAGVLAGSEHLFHPRPAILWQEDKQTWHGGGDDLFRARNPPDAIFSYFLKARASTPVKIQIVDAEGGTVRELDGAGEAGLHRVRWDLRRNRPNASRPGDRVAPGVYMVRLSVNGRILVSSIDVDGDPGR
jgi:hypothetical protein